MSKCPEQYQETIKDFVYEYFNQRKWQIENNFLVMLPIEAQSHIYQNWDSTPLGDQLCEIARAAAGKIKNDADGFNRGVVYEGIQNLMEQLFAPPGLSASYDIPNSFWKTPLGDMVSLAFLWIQQDELITQAEAGKLVNVTTQAINQATRDGRLKIYKDPNAPERQGRTLVSKKEVIKRKWGKDNE